MNYSLLVMDSTGMMKMTTGEGSPLRRVPGRAPERFLVATEACGGRTPDLSSILEVLGYKSIYGCRGYVGGATGVPRGRGRAQGGVLHPREHLPYLLTCTPSPSGGFPSKNNFSS